MQHYQEITLLPNNEIGHYFLWSKVYQQLHLALATLANGEFSNVGVSFPEYSNSPPRLGRKVRLFAEESTMLNALNITEWLSRLSDYCHISSIKPVPEITEFVQVSRKQCVTNPERLARRRAKRKGESFEQALAHYEGLKVQGSRLPFVEIQSESSHNVGDKHRFRLLVDQQRVKAPQTGLFSCYGLSKTATVPWF
ncbi:type I-F CRISPR-associated endoribonuclease Cas6/Csy4 [Pseudoalteromonas sp.]|uniref:type I-F CRISPR-associated endoribonuclease Cas6/Csy4 n=1 Tax=Pseudoalteromonas sp. TaxID=53249 RepID=UPI003D0BB801